MPSGSLLHRGGYSLRQRAAKHSRDKAVQAQRKNKLETAQLQLFNSIVDRKKVQTTVMLNQEKDEIRSKMKQMRKTTGLYKGSLPPDGPGDKEHEKSSYFQTLGHVSEKRLQKWKNEERALQRIKLTEDRLRAPWEKSCKDTAQQSLGQLLGELGYDEHETKVMLRDLDEDNKPESKNDGRDGGIEVVTERSPSKAHKLRSASTSSFGGLSSFSERLDVFESLRGKCKGNFHLDEATNGPRSIVADSSFPDKNDVNRQSEYGKRFSVKSWEKSMVEQYKKQLINPAPQANKNESQKGRLGSGRPRSAPPQTGTGLKNGNLLSKRKQRSHAKYCMSQSDKTESISGTPGGEKEMIRNEMNKGEYEGRRCRPLTALPPRAVEATRGILVDSSSRPKTAYRKVTNYTSLNTSPTDTPPDEKTPPQGAQEKSVLDREKLNQNGLTVSTPTEGGSEQETGTEDGGRGSEIEKKTKGERKMGAEENKNVLNKDVNSLEKASGGNKTGGAREPADKAGGKKGPCFTRSMSLPASTPLNITGVLNKSPALDKLEEGKTRDVSRRRAHSVAVDLSQGEFDLEADLEVGPGRRGSTSGSTSGGTSGVRAELRRRLLAAETSPGLPGDQKVRLAVSRSQLRRDMEKMIVDQESDMKEQIRKKRIRQMRKRMAIYLTLEKLAKKPPREEDKTLSNIKI